MVSICLNMWTAFKKRESYLNKCGSTYQSSDLKSMVGTHEEPKEAKQNLKRLENTNKFKEACCRKKNVKGLFGNVSSLIL